MQIEVKTRMRITGEEPEVIMDLLLKPRGSGNRHQARLLGRAFRNHRILGDHVKKVVVGSSRVTVHLRATLDAIRAVNECAEENRRNQPVDVPGQLKLFGI